MLKSQDSSATASSQWAGCADGSRIVVKAGTALLTGGGEHIDIEVVASLVGQIARLHSRGSEMLLVSSGAVAAGRRVLGRVLRGQQPASEAGACGCGSGTPDAYLRAAFQPGSRFR